VPDKFLRLVELVRFELGLSKDIPPLEAEEIQVWNLARQHKVATLLSPHIILANRDPQLVNEARYVWQLAALREEYFSTKCDELLQFLKCNDIQAFPLKGVALVKKAYPKKGQRPFRDVDLLLNPSDLFKADQLMLEKGYCRIRTTGPLPRALKTRGDMLEAAAMGIDAVSYQKGELYVELHTVIVPPVLGSFSLEHVWKSKGGFSPEDFLIHLCFHSTRHHFLYGLRHLVDVAVWSQKKKPDFRLIQDKLEFCGLTFLAWPTWKLAYELFPEVVKSPCSIKNFFLNRYTDSVRRHFALIPIYAIKLAGSPIPLVMMRPNPLKSISLVVLGNKKLAIYQIGESQNGLRRIAWKVARPFGLLWRHAPILWKWLAFQF